ncbi:MAG: bile acid:sodium symporter, partial [Candidatus Aenigmatarchaeota archaeon]
MPVHGLRADLELVALTVSAAVFSYFLTSQIVSNVMFATLIAGLFFLEGLHIDLGFIDDVRRRSKQYLLGILSIYLVAPLVALGFSMVFPSLRNLLLVIGISAGALGSPRVWSNLSKADGKLAGRVGSLSIVLALFMTPLLILVLPVEIDLSMLMRNSVIAIIPFAAGIGLKNYRGSWVEDARNHFSKLCFWLIVVITLAQFDIILSSGQPGFLAKTAEASIILLGFSVGMYFA